MSKQKIFQYFQKNDEVIFLLAKKVGTVKELYADKPENYFHRLCREIIGQQLASGAARTIFSRFEALFTNKKITSRKVQNISHQAMRKAGLSNAKAGYIRDLAEKVINKELDFKSFESLSDEQVTAELTKVKGIGPWTASMFLLAVLTRRDIFSPGDLALRKAIKIAYGLKEMPTEKQAEEISYKWKPYRTYASLVLWKSLKKI